MRSLYVCACACNDTATTQIYTLSLHDALPIFTISGKVADQLHVPLSIIINDTSHNIAYLAQTSPGTDGTYSTQAVAGGSTWRTAGVYEVDVTYGGPDKTATTTFEFTSSPSQVQNQTNNTTPAIPEFGPLSVSIFAISIAIIVTYAKMRPTFKI